MADDLDAFFEEVSAAEAEAVEEEKQEPPAKKQKTVRPVGVVVAAAASSKKTNSDATETTNQPDTIGVTSLPPTNTSTIATSTATTTILPPLPTNPVVAPPLPPGVPPPPPPPNNKSKKPRIRTAAGKTWVDESLNEWPENDYRIFVGNLSADVTDQQLYQHFSEYQSIAKAKVVRNKEGVSKGYGFVSMMKPLDCAKAIREKDQTWLGTNARPIRTKRSDWKERDYKVAKKKQKKKGYLKY